jgi:hypothetical protein
MAAAITLSYFTIAIAEMADTLILISHAIFADAESRVAFANRCHATPNSQTLSDDAEYTPRR